jgi:hypothetical protein
MRNTSCLTSTGARNIGRAASMLDRSRLQARQRNVAVLWVTAHGASAAFPSDLETGSVWPMGSMVDAIDQVEAAGWQWVMLGEGGLS